MRASHSPALPPTDPGLPPTATAAPEPTTKAKTAILEDAERAHVLSVLESCDWKVKARKRR